MYPSELRNLLTHLALTGLFQAKWSAALHEEWVCALLRRRPDLSREKLGRTRMAIPRFNASFTRTNCPPESSSAEKARSSDLLRTSTSKSSTKPRPR